MFKILRLAILYPLCLILGISAMGAALAFIVLLICYPRLPDIEVLMDYRPKMPLQVFSSDGVLIGEFGEERRAPVKIAEVPKILKLAILATEDDRFYQHKGVDPVGVLRAAYNNMRGGKQQGGSTITMQVARNFFLSSERTMTRKLYESLLSFKIESSLSKDQIFEIYINQIFLGQRAYGFAGASQVYFGKPLSEISLAEASMLAGLPNSPGKINPITNPKGSKTRQAHVLRRMRDLGYIGREEYEHALNEALVIKRDSAALFPVHAKYVAEMARQIAAERFPEEVYTSGLQVITTINSEAQDVAYRALRQGVMEYDQRHGYRGAESFIDLGQPAYQTESGSFTEALDQALQKFAPSDNLLPAVILNIQPGKIKAYVYGGETVTLEGDDIRFAANMMGNRVTPNQKLRPGSVIRVVKEQERWRITQLPNVESAFIAASPVDGSVQALVGGFDFNRGMYNRVTQAWRQPGSSFKPFIYSAALEKGFSPGSIVLDEPIEFPADATGSRIWHPKNYDGKYEGPMKMRTALAKSKNMPTVRLIDAISPAYTQDYITRFGFDAARHPPYLTMALGAGSVSPWQMAAAYSVFANGGYRISPYIVKEIRDRYGRVIAKAAPLPPKDEKNRVIDPRNAYLMYSMLRDVTIYGTAARASVALKRHDLAGKTGTTNDYQDAWFCGFQQSLVGCAWMGFDLPRKLGNRETGGYAALPIWINYMQYALKDVPENLLPQPQGLSTAQGDMYYSENTPRNDPAILDTLDINDENHPASREGLPPHIPPSRPETPPPSEPSIKIPATFDPFPSD